MSIEYYASTGSIASITHSMRNTMRCAIKRPCSPASPVHRQHHQAMPVVMLSCHASRQIGTIDRYLYPHDQAPHAELVKPSLDLKRPSCNTFNSLAERTVGNRLEKGIMLP
jgi:hypothetical protein